MALDKYIPNKTQVVNVAVAIAILAMILRYVPIPENIKQLFRL